MASLRELQRDFAAALDDPAVPCAVRPASRLEIYRGTARHNFLGALQAAFPVIRRRVGDDYFAQLAHHYRRAHPSRSGDLHWVGREFATFLDGHLAAGDYAWLADLARLEWARQCSAVEAVVPSVGVESLATVAAEELEHLTLTLQPSLRLVSSPYPVLSVWLANQQESATPVDQSIGSEAGMTLARADGVEVARLEADAFSYLYALAQGASLGEALGRSGIDAERLGPILGFIFGEGLVIGTPARKRGPTS